MPLPTIDDAPWGVAVKKGEPAFAALMSGMVVNWHLSGRIIELEKKYGLQPTPFAQKMHEMLQIGRAHVELQSLLRISYAVFCLKQKNNQYRNTQRCLQRQHDAI